jgi:hypothetical protein
MHLVSAPSTLIKFSVISLKYSLSFSYSFAVLTFILVASNIKSEAEAISGAFVKHSLVAETILK